MRSNVQVALVRDGEAISGNHLSTACKKPDLATYRPPAACPPRSSASSVGADSCPTRRSEWVLLRHVRATVEATYIGQVMREHGGNVSRAARALGLSRPSLQKKIKQYRLR